MIPPPGFEMPASGRVMLVGESNPYGDDPDMTLYPFPDGCSGHRLWRVLGVGRTRYLSFARENLCRGIFRMPDARERASILRDHVKEATYPPEGVRPFSLVILCGTRVRQAFGFHDLATWDHVDDVDTHVTWLALPHPNGRSRIWGAGMWGIGGSVARVRETLRMVCPHVPWGEEGSP